MKRVSKRVLAMLLALTMVFSLCMVSASATPKLGVKYMAIGDSITKMDDIPYADTNGITRYAKLVCDALEITGPAFYDGSHNGWRTDELRLILDKSYAEEYQLDDVAMTFLPSWTGETSFASLTDLREEYCGKIAKAENITIELGSNDLLAMLAYNIYHYIMMANPTDTYSQKVIARTIKSAEKLDLPEAVLTMLGAVQSLDMMRDFTKAVAKDTIPAIADFKENWDEIIKGIRKLNPDAKIVVLGVYNPAETMTKSMGAMMSGMGMDMDNMGSILKPIVEPIMDSLNNYMQYASKQRLEYAFVDISGIDLSDSPDGGHPGTIGQKYIAEKIIAQLEDMPAYCSCKHENTYTLLKYPATYLTVGYTGDVYCKDCGELIQQGSVVFWTGAKIEIPNNVVESTIDMVEEQAENYIETSWKVGAAVASAAAQQIEASWEIGTKIASDINNGLKAVVKDYFNWFFK